VPERREQLIKTTKPGRGGTIRVTFTLPADEPRGAVSVVGDFNDWNPFVHPLRRRANGTRSVAVTVPAGSMLRFRYLAWWPAAPQAGWPPPGCPPSSSDPQIRIEACGDHFSSCLAITTRWIWLVPS